MRHSSKVVKGSACAQGCVMTFVHASTDAHMVPHAHKVTNASMTAPHTINNAHRLTDASMTAPHATTDAHKLTHTSMTTPHTITDAHKLSDASMTTHLGSRANVCVCEASNTSWHTKLSSTLQATQW